MAKAKTVYSCTECGGQSPKWQGQCPHCNAWNTLVETVATPPGTRFQTVAGKSTSVRSLGTIDARKSPRFPTGLEEFDRVLGGGLVPGGVILLGGDPGIGKSTLLLQAMAAIGAAKKALYVTGEESVEQVALRAQRLGLINAPVSMLAEVQLEAIVAAIAAEAPEVVVIDSIQTAYTEALASAPGSVAQVRECAAQLTRLAKERHIVVIFVGHVTKEGAIAGPRVLEHIVDTVLYFEGDTHSSFRLVRAIKNRFGIAPWTGSTSAWISTSSGRDPSSVATTADPATFSPCCDRNSADGLATPRNPRSVIANTPSSLAAPKRFLMARTSRKLECVSPSK